MNLFHHRQPILQLTMNTDPWSGHHVSKPGRRALTWHEPSLDPHSDFALRRTQAKRVPILARRAEIRRWGLKDAAFGVRQNHSPGEIHRRHSVRKYPLSRSSTAIAAHSETTSTTVLQIRAGSLDSIGISTQNGHSATVISAGSPESPTADCSGTGADAQPIANSMISAGTGMLRCRGKR